MAEKEKMRHRGRGREYKASVSCSTSLPGGNQVDGLPPVRHTEAIVGAQGKNGPAPIHDIDTRKSKI